MQILLFGKHGQLGWELQRTLAPLGHVVALDIPEIDFSRPENVQETVLRIKPQIIINTSAYTAVDRAEDEPQIAMAVNGYAPGLLASLAADLGVALIHYSTDFVFDGGKGSPYRESDTPNPLNVYGRSKLAGEKAIQEVDRAYLILRTSWVYSMRGDSFVNKVLRWSRQQTKMRLVTDQVSNPTWARMLAEVTAQMIAKADRDVSSWLHERRGLYHLAGSDFTSRLEWGKAILRYDPHKEEQVAHEILPAQTSDFETTAQRPLFSALNCELFSDTFSLRMPPWKEMLQLAMSVK